LATALAGPLSLADVARELGLSRNTVGKYLDQSEPVRRGYKQRARPVWERVQSRVEELVTEWEPRTTICSEMACYSFDALVEI